MKKTTALSISILAAALCAALPSAAAFSTNMQKPMVMNAAAPGGAVLWFNSVMRPAGIPVGRVASICVTHQVITIQQGRDITAIEVPDAKITFKPWESSASIQFRGNQWISSVPTAFASQESFISGAALPLPAGYSTATVTWSAAFASDVPGVTVQWRWGAGSYTMFSDLENELDIEPVDNRNHDRAGTPFAFKSYVLGGDDADANDFADTRFTGKRSLYVKSSADVATNCGGGVY